MRLQRYLIHVCTLEREVKTKGDHGADIKTWTEQPPLNCRFFAFDQSVADPSRGQMLQYDAKIMLRPNNDVSLTDRVKSIVLEDGTILSGSWLVERIVHKRLLRNLATVLLLRKPEEGT